MEVNTMANIVRWEPLNDLVSLRDAMDRLFEESVVAPRKWMPSFGEGLAVDVFETPDNVVVKSAVPGVKSDDLNITIVGDTVTIKGEFKAEEGVEEKNYIRRERRYGSFSRSIPLPTSVDADKATAEFEDGILTLNIPKAETVKPRTVQITSKS
jgi:HSP20 family protein